MNGQQTGDVSKSGQGWDNSPGGKVGRRARSGWTVQRVQRM